MYVRLLNFKCRIIHNGEEIIDLEDDKVDRSVKLWVTHEKNGAFR